MGEGGLGVGWRFGWKWGGAEGFLEILQGPLTEAEIHCETLRRKA